MDDILYFDDLDLSISVDIRSIWFYLYDDQGDRETSRIGEIDVDDYDFSI